MVKTALREPDISEAALDQLYLEIYRSEATYVAYQLRRLGVREADIPDLTHDVFIIARRHLAEFDRERPVRPWLFGILFRAAANDLRRYRHRHEVLPGAKQPPIEGEDPAPKPDDAVIDQQARTIASAVFDSLDPRLRVVLELHDLADRPVAEIAARLGIPLKTVYTRLRLARARFAGAATEARRKATPAWNRSVVLK